MDGLNYHHLRYFWTAVTAGGVTAAADALGVAQPTVSAQLRALEAAVGGVLFVRGTRPLELTERGRTVARYAEQIFALGRELEDTLSGRPVGGPARLRVGIGDGVPKLIATMILRPALRANPPVHVVAQEGRIEALAEMLADRSVDLVLADGPISVSGPARSRSIEVATSGVAFFGTVAVAKRLDGPFPQCLEGAPMLLPTSTNALRREVEEWLSARDLRPRVVAEVEDSAMLKSLGMQGYGVFPAPDLVTTTIRRQYRVEAIGTAWDLREAFHVVLPARREPHPIAVAIAEQRFRMPDA